MTSSSKAATTTGPVVVNNTTGAIAKTSLQQHQQQQSRKIHTKQQQQQQQQQQQPVVQKLAPQQQQQSTTTGSSSSGSGTQPKNTHNNNSNNHTTKRTTNAITAPNNNNNANFSNEEDVETFHHRNHRTVNSSTASSSIQNANDDNERFEDKYRLLNKLSKGSFGIVYRTENIITKEEYAVKVIERAELNEKEQAVVEREVSILHDLRTVPHIVQLVNFYCSPTRYYVVQEFAQGGDVFERLAQRTTYTEKDARDLAVHLLEAIDELHSRKLAHRDLKPENLLLRSMLDDTSILVADFGFAAYVPPNGLKTRCGTPAFVAPQILLPDCRYDERVDMWSVGCLLYMLIAGYPPFQDKDHRSLFRKVRGADFVFHDLYWRSVSKSAKQLISSMLTIDPKYRCTARMAIDKSNWLKMDASLLKENDLAASLGEIKRFHARRTLKSAIHTVLWSVKYKTKSANDVGTSGSNPQQQHQQKPKSLFTGTATNNNNNNPNQTSNNNSSNNNTNALMDLSHNHNSQTQTEYTDYSSNPDLTTMLKKIEESNNNNNSSNNNSTNINPILKIRYNDDDDDNDDGNTNNMMFQSDGFLLTKLRNALSFHDIYTLQELLHTGQTAKVYQCYNQRTFQKFAVKIINRSDASNKKSVLGRTLTETVLHEVAVLDSLQHPNIMSVLDYYEDDDNFYLILERMYGGDVFDHIIHSKQSSPRFQEHDAKVLMYTLLNAVSYFHEQGIAHRDLKPQNLLLKTKDDYSSIKITDFGFACRVHSPQSLISRCGTPSYVAPEVLKNIPYDQSCDMWSCGVILYLLLCGIPPFVDDNQSELFRKIRTAEYKFRKQDTNTISSEAKHLIKRLLVANPLQRLTAKQALRSPWFANMNPQHGFDNPSTSTGIPTAVTSAVGSSKRMENTTAVAVASSPAAAAVAATATAAAATATTTTKETTIPIPTNHPKPVIDDVDGLADDEIEALRAVEQVLNNPQASDIRRSLARGAGQPLQRLATSSMRTSQLNNSNTTKLPQQQQQQQQQLQQQQQQQQQLEQQHQQQDQQIQQVKDVVSSSSKGVEESVQQQQQEPTTRLNDSQPSISSLVVTEDDPKKAYSLQQQREQQQHGTVVAPPSKRVEQTTAVAVSEPNNSTEKTTSETAAAAAGVAATAATTTKNKKETTRRKSLGNKATESIVMSMKNLFPRSKTPSRQAMEQTKTKQNNQKQQQQQQQQRPQHRMDEHETNKTKRQQQVQASTKTTVRNNGITSTNTYATMQQSMLAAQQVSPSRLQQKPTLKALSPSTPQRSILKSSKMISPGTTTARASLVPSTKLLGSPAQQQNRGSVSNTPTKNTVSPIAKKYSPSSSTSSSNNKGRIDRLPFTTPMNNDDDNDNHDHDQNLDHQNNHDHEEESVTKGYVLPKAISPTPVRRKLNSTTATRRPSSLSKQQANDDNEEEVERIEI